MSEVRRVLLANGQYIEIVQETGTSTGSVMSQNAVTTALKGKANSSHNHTASNITGGTFSSAMIADGAVTSGKLATNAVVNAKIADGAVTSSKVSDGAITSGKLASNAVVNAKIVDGAVTSGKLASNSVITAKILDKAVTKAKLADDVISSLPSSSYETVIVNGSLNHGPIKGKQVYINSLLYTFNETGKIYVAMPYGQVYIVTPNFDGTAYGNGGGTYTASTSTRNIDITYTINNGVYIEDKSGKLYAPSYWSSGNNANANSIVVLNDEKSFRVSLTNSTDGILQTNQSTTWASGLTAATSAATAYLDFNGSYNTQQILAAATGYAAQLCASYTFPDGVTKGHLPAVGELDIAWVNRTAINQAAALCGGSGIVIGSPSYYWSSTYMKTETSGGYTYVYFWKYAFYSNRANLIGSIVHNDAYIKPFADY